jgi:hypothetical protein
MDLYAGLTKSKMGADPAAKPKTASLFGGGLYGDLPESAAAKDQTTAERAASEADAAETARMQAARGTKDLDAGADLFDDEKKPTGSTASAGPTGAAKAAASWGASKFLTPTFRKRQQPAAAARPSAAQVAAKQQKIASETTEKTQGTAVSLRESSTAKEAVSEEYDPNKPHDYEQLLKMRKRQKILDEQIKKQELQEKRRARLADQASKEPAAAPPDRDAAPAAIPRHIAAGAGRGRGVNLPAWMTAGSAGGGGDTSPGC